MGGNTYDLSVRLFRSLYVEWIINVDAYALTGGKRKTLNEDVWHGVRLKWRSAKFGNKKRYTFEREISFDALTFLCDSIFC
jgi:hypothetical protein